MQHQATAAYQQARRTASPRELEAGLLLSAAARLQFLIDSGARQRPDIEAAVTFNYKIWMIFTTCAIRGADRLPPDLRRTIAETGFFVLRNTATILKARADRRIFEHLPGLIEINRAVATGLRA